MEKINLLEKKLISKVISRLAHEIIEKNKNLDKIAIVGIRTRGDIIAKRILAMIKDFTDFDLKQGTLDVTFHRDDFSSNFGSPKVGPSEITFNMNDVNVILVDDVLYTGRTIRAAIDEIFAYGRPASIQLAVLVDRGHRELPIKANYVGKNYPTKDNEHIHVYVQEIDNKEEICLIKN